MQSRRVVPGELKMVPSTSWQPADRPWGQFVVDVGLLLGFFTTCIVLRFVVVPVEEMWCRMTGRQPTLSIRMALWF